MLLSSNPGPYLGQAGVPSLGSKSSPFHLFLKWRIYVLQAGLQLLNWNDLPPSTLEIVGTKGAPHQAYGNSLKWKQLNLHLSINWAKSQVLQKDFFFPKRHRAKCQVAYTCNSNTQKVAAWSLLGVWGQPRLCSKTISKKWGRERNKRKMGWRYGSIAGRILA